MANFQRGDVCVGQGLVEYPEYNGAECEVLDVSPEGVAAFDVRGNSIDVIPAVAYRVEWADGQAYWVHEKHLRRRPPEQGWAAFRRLTGMQDKVPT